MCPVPGATGGEIHSISQVTIDDQRVSVCDVCELDTILIAELALPTEKRDARHVVNLLTVRDDVYFLIDGNS